MFKTGDKVMFRRGFNYKVNRAGQVLYIPYKSIGKIGEVRANGFVQVFVNGVVLWICVNGSDVLVKA